MKKQIWERAEFLNEKIGFDKEKMEELRSNLNNEWSMPKITKEFVPSLIDHTVLSFNATIRDIENVCKEAFENKFKAICINPVWIKDAVDFRKSLNANFLIATVVDFPLGASSKQSRIIETKQALEDGADEIDLVISIGLLKSGKFKETYALMKDVADLKGYLKVILEISELNNNEKIDATLLAFFAGANMLKTSTGVNGKATVEDVKILRAVAGNTLGVKAAGGIRTLENLTKMVEAGASRIGASSSVKIMSEL